MPAGAMQAYLFLGLFAGGAALACAGLYFWKSNQIKDLEAQIEKAEKRQKELQAIKAQVDALLKKRETFQRKVEIIEKLKADQSGPVHLLDEVSKALPDFVWLGAMQQGGPGVKLDGQSNSLTAIADYITNLQRSGWFPTVDLAGATGDPIVNFSINASFQNKAAATPAPPAAPAAPPAAKK